MFGAYVVMAHPPRLFECDFDDFLDAGGGDDLLNDDPLRSPEHCFDGFPNHANLDAKVAENLGRESFSFLHEAQQHVFGSDVAVMRSLGFALRERENPLCSFGEPFERIRFRPLSTSELRFGMRAKLVHVRLHVGHPFPSAPDQVVHLVLPDSELGVIGGQKSDQALQIDFCPPTASISCSREAVWALASSKYCTRRRALGRSQRLMTRSPTSTRKGPRRRARNRGGASIIGTC